MEYLKVSIIVSLAIFLTAVHNVYCKNLGDSQSHSEDRVHNPEGLSDHAHFGVHNVHNSAYDHDAFLGEEEAKKFGKLSPEQSRLRLGKVVETIDKNKDGFVSDAELKDQIHHNQNRYIYRDADRLWNGQNMNKDHVITWAEYNYTSYSGMSEEQMIQRRAELGGDILKRLKHDKRRWKAADQDGDNQMNINEFPPFLHPEGFDHMRDIVVVETMEDMDKDGDGLLSLEEFIADLLAREGPLDKEPEWVAREREYFMVTRDKNGDGKMNSEELREWIFPTDHDPAEAETNHLIYEADVNKDGRLTKEEILANHDLFAGSQATEFGRNIKDHDEF